ncbi:NAD(P)H-dependent oxidoreductase [Mucilaginibacter pallidiroseus]|uniref:NAD(P)H-dependent oxidoreductase n=1 Tax=Mucilaginibacter pallidiroseus TaxID=2599295 RepID=A0A563UJC6_9SPHI|nr:NAD(P)H-dependent oxidoreductase [Mucilaginibacter pallidiroseus]TWR31490.1 NAD(P)H-dependent oxidoreductase [Mucilaginibacter pallidiroseus]
MKTLIIVTHPNLETSVINKRWVEELQKYPDQYYIHNLHGTYPDGKIDVQREQALIEQYEKIVFQFPFYWFSCPGLLKTWFDDILTHGWAYGSQSGYKMGGKIITLAITAGVDEEEYTVDGRYRYTVNELIRPFKLSFEYIKADYRPFFAYYGLDYKIAKDGVEESVQPYLDFLRAL